MPSRAERLRSAGLDPPLSSSDLRRIAAERQLARFGKLVNPELEESVSGSRTVSKTKTVSAPITRGDLDVDELVIRVPMPETLTNSGKGRSRHWYALHDEKKRYWRQLDTLQLTGFIQAPPRRQFIHATVRSLMTLGGKMDDDNAMARHKWVIDWLATRGYIRNDRLLRWSAMPTQVVKRGGEYTIELTLTRVNE